MYLVEAIANIVPLMQIMHDSGFYQFMPQYMNTFGPNTEDQPSIRDLIKKFKER